MVHSQAVFIDQTAFLAFIGHPEYSEYHEIINNWLQSFFKGEFSTKYDILVTSDYVVLSVIEKLFENKLNDNIILFVKNLIRSSSIKILNVHEDGFTHACRNIETYYSIFKFNFSFTDIATLFLLKSSKIKALLTVNPSFHRLEYLIRLDFNPDKDQDSTSLFYDAIPDTVFNSEKESPFLIYDNQVRPEDAIYLFDIELSQWAIKKISVDQENYVTGIQLDYEFESKHDDKRAEMKPIPDSIFKLERLVNLDLSDIKFIKTDKLIFQQLSLFNKLKSIKFSKNNLKKIPETLDKLQSKDVEIII